MRRPLRKFFFILAEKLGKSVKEILEMDSSEISEWSAYCLTQNDTWLATYRKGVELERQANMTNEERAIMFKRLLGAKK